MIYHIPCPSKINLFLSVGPKDTTGYHSLRTIFQAIGLYDELILSDETDEIQVTSDWEGLPKENTLTRTLRYVSEITPLPSLRIHLKKNIPTQSGLGGGSSNAAMLLLGLQKFLTHPLIEEQLYMIADAVGKDVPFFLVGGCAKAEGYGEKLTPLPDLPKQWVVVVKPDANISTPKAYAALDAMERFWHPFPGHVGCLYNDFELVAPRECLQIKEKLLELDAEGALLCGSGSAVFGLYTTQERAEKAQEHLVQQGYTRSYVVPTLTRRESLWMS